MLEFDTLIASTINSGRAALSDEGWARLSLALAFCVDRSTGGRQAQFSVRDGGPAAGLRPWLEARPARTRAYLAEAFRPTATALPAQIEAGFKGGGLSAGLVVQEPQRDYHLALAVSTKPEYETTGQALRTFLDGSKHRAQYLAGLQAALSFPGDLAELERSLAALTPGAALSETVAVLRAVAKAVQAPGKDFARWLQAVPYADRTRAELTVVPLAEPPSAERDLPAARARLQSALRAVRALTLGDADAEVWRRFFDTELASFDAPYEVPTQIRRVSRHPRGPEAAPSVEAILQTQGAAPEALHLVGCALQCDSIFGGMGSWNDTPYAHARESAELYAAAHAAYRVAVNQGSGKWAPLCPGRGP